MPHVSSTCSLEVSASINSMLLGLQQHVSRGSTCFYSIFFGFYVQCEWRDEVTPCRIRTARRSGGVTSRLHELQRDGEVDSHAVAAPAAGGSGVWRQPAAAASLAPQARGPEVHMLHFFSHLISIRIDHIRAPFLRHASSGVVVPWTGTLEHESVI